MASRTYTTEDKLKPLGYQQITPAAATGLSPPKEARVALIQAFTQNVRWRDDGTDPTVNSGMVLEAGRDMLYTGNLAAIKFIEITPSAEINISYYF